MKKITTFLLALLLTIPAMAVDLTGGEVLYLKTNGSTNWAADNARFCMYLCNGTSSAEWVDMTLVETGIYQGVVPSGKNHKNVIFVRMNPSSSSNSWSNKWNQTADLTYDGTKNLFTPSGWDDASTTWSTYTPPVAEELVIPDGLFSYNEGEYAVFFVNNGGFSTPTVHVWGGYSTTRPGTKMTKIDGQVNNKYDCYKWVITTTDDVPTGLIISDNGGTKASGGDLVYVNGGVYDGNGELLTTITATPVVEPTITLSYSPETIYVGDVVTLSSTVLNGDGYTVKYYVDGVENGETWTPTAAGDYTLTANLMNGEYVKASNEKTVTVKEHTVFYAYLMKEGAWETTYIYYWGDTGNTWPGTALSETETIEGNEYYKYAFNDVATVNIIFNAGDGKAQTSNIEGVTATAYYRITNQAGGDGSVESSATPFAAPAQPTLFVSGTMNDWDVTDPMTYENGEFTWTGDLNNGDEFKFRVAEDWSAGSYGYSEVTFAAEYTVSKNENDNNIIWTGLYSNVTITVSGDYKTVTIVVNEVKEETENLVFTVTVPEGTDNCYIIGNFAGSDWATPVVMEKVSDIQYTITINDLYRSTVKYKYVTNGEANLAAGDVWKNEEVTAEGGKVDSRNYSENDVVAMWKGLYKENIVCEKNYYLDTNGIWNTDGAWFAAYFFNKNTDASTWVKGELVNGYYLFYLSKYNVPAAAPARANAEESEAPVYTHVIFTRMNPEFSVLDWDKTEVVDNGDGTTTTNVIEDRVWNQTADLTYNGTEDNALATFQITSPDGAGTWINLPSGIEAVEAADGIVYAGNVVTAEGAIEVYNMSGAVVAYGEDALDLRGLNAGIYVVRNGNNVLKVVR